MAEPKTISATAPPTIANLAVGFDILGLAVEGQGDVLSISQGDSPGIHLSIEGDGAKLSTEPEKNTATAGIVAMMKDLGRADALHVHLTKRMPLGSGMGSSASSAAAGVLAANLFFGNPFAKEELVKYALIGEAVASGAVHGDNVVPSLLGGLILMRRNEPADVLRLPFLEDLSILLIHPHVEVLTSESRGRLDPRLDMKTFITQSADTAAFIHAMHSGDMDLLRRCMNDLIIGPQRQQDIPLYREVDERMRGCHAVNYNISGSGPSSFAFFESESDARMARSAVLALFAEKGIGCDIEITRVDTQGARSI